MSRAIPPFPPQRPDHTPRAVDRLLVPLAVAAAAGFCAAAGVPDDRALPRFPAFFGCGLVGLLLPRAVHRYRAVGLTLYGPLLAAILAGVALYLGDWPTWLTGGFALGLGAAVGGIVRYRDRFRREFRRFTWVSAAAGLAGLGVVAAYFAAGDESWRPAYAGVALGASGLVAGLALVTLARPALEFVLVPVLRVLYKLSAAGPGLTSTPLDGPVLVIANHADWFDPLLVAGVLSRPITPLMTAGFFDLPVIRPVVWHVFRTIRVPEIPIRRDAPEVYEAVKALDVDRAVVIFPEGYLRRTEAKPLRRFGQGAWQILKARPATPVVACWVEGTWGSYFSHAGGPPTRGKKLRLLFRRPVRIGVSAPVTVPADLLDDHLRARTHLAQLVLGAREHLGLPPVAAEATADGAE